MTEPVPTRESNRREMLKWTGMGVLGGAAGQALRPQPARAAEGAVGISYASWIHGHSMQVEYPDQIARHDRKGWGTDIWGKPGTENWFHFAIPTPVIINDVRMQVDSVLLSFETASADAFVRDVHVYDGWNRIAMFDGVNLSGNQSVVRFTLPDTPAIGLGLGISLGVGFGVEAMDHLMRFYAAGCDFVIRPSA